MPGFSIDVSQVNALADRLSTVGAGLGARVSQVVLHHTALLDLEMKRAASGRPGPNVITGDFRRSITHDVVTGGLRSEGAAGSGAPQAARLEWGFTGTDSIGRHYNQPPYPWARPALDRIEPAFSEAMARLGEEQVL